MMSGFHGLFSFGGIAGASVVTALLGKNAAPSTAIFCVIACVILALAISCNHLLAYGSRSDGPPFAVPHGFVLFIGALCFVLFLTEGSLLDWSAVFLTSIRGMEESRAGLGYAAFSVTMTTGRLMGDRIVHRFGPERIVLFGGLCAAVGVALATLVPSWEVALAGYALVGVGCSNIVPVLFSAAGRQKAMPENIAVAAITTLGYLGVLAGPAVIGFIARAAGLPTAFLILASLLAGVAASSRFLRGHPRS